MEHNAIDNIDLIIPLLTFESEDDFYYLQIIQRKKENPELKSNSRVIKNYYISNIEYLEQRWQEIKSLCHLYNARAMLRLNKRSYRKTAFKTMQNIANSMANGEYQHIKKSYDRACGKGHNNNNKTWIVDIDGEYNPEILQHINNTQPQGDKIIAILPTKNGVHLITKPFNQKDFKHIGVDAILKDNPTNLYIPL